MLTTGTFPVDFLEVCWLAAEPHEEWGRGTEKPPVSVNGWIDSKDSSALRFLPKTRVSHFRQKRVAWAGIEKLSIKVRGKAHVLQRNT